MGPALAAGFVGTGIEAVIAANGLPTHGVIASAGAVLGTRALEALAAERSRRVSKALRVAEDISGLSREELDDLIADDPTSVSLVLQLLQAAGNAGDESVLKLIGYVVGVGIKDPDVVERQSTLLLAIDGLNAAHIRMLGVLAREHIPEGHSYEADIVADWLKESSDVVRMLGTGLLLRGLIENPYGGYGGGEYYSLSQLGVEVVNAAMILEKGEV